MMQLLALIPPKDAQILLGLLPILGAGLSLARKFWIPDGSKLAKFIDPIIGLLPLDLHKASGS